MIEHAGKYYEWADNRIIALLEALDEESFVKVLEGARRSLRDLAEHLLVYYMYFVYRKSKVPFKTLQAKLKKMNQAELLNHWKQVLGEFSDALENSGEGSVDIPLAKGRKARISGDAYLFAFTDHATYHRGQLITTYKAITGQKAVATDYYDFLIDHLKNG